MRCDEALPEVSVCVLRGQPVPADVTKHLVMCPQCSAEAEQLMAMRPLLADAVPVTSATRPDEVGLQRLLAAAHRSSRVRRRRQWLAVATAVVVAVALAVGTGVIVQQRALGRFTPVTAAAVSASTGVSGTVRLSAAGTGSQLGLTVNGVAPGTRCSLVVVDSAGNHHVAAWWRVSYTGTASVAAHSPVPARDVAVVELVNAHSGKTLLSMRTA